MAYSVAADIESEFKDISFSAVGAKLATAEVTVIIAQHDALIDSYLASRYTTPITGTRALLIMQMLSVALTKVRAIDILEMRGVPAKDTQIKKTMGYDEVIKYLKELQSGKARLTDAIEVSSTGGVGVSSGSRDCRAKFDSCKQQW